MRRFYCLALLALGLCSVLCAPLAAGEYKLSNGDVIKGEPVSYDDLGVVIRLEIGGFSPRINWSKLTQEALTELSKDPKAAIYAEPFIDIPPEVRREQRKKKEIVVQPVPRAPIPEKGNFLSAFSTPVGLVMAGALFFANVFAGYAVARFRNRPVGVVCAVSAILPVAGPLLFLSMPTLEAPPEEYAPVADESQAPAPAAAHSKGTREVGKPSGGGLSIAAAKEESGKGAEPAVYKRGDFTFNRRFFETKFSGFFRLVPSEADKDLVLVLKMAKGEHLAKRISRIASNEMHVQLLHGGSEVMVPFAEIAEVRVRHKDAKA